jgi:hypothetical protein
MKELKDLEFRLSDKEKFTPKRNVDILFPYLAEMVREVGVVDLQEVARKLAERFEGHSYEPGYAHALYSTAKLVSPQFGLKTTRFNEAIRKCYPDVDETRGFHDCRDSVLLYKEEDTLLEYIKSITIKRNIIRVELKEEGSN